MASCKECLHYELCNYNAVREAIFTGNMNKYITLAHQITCKFFKNKAEYQEVKHAEWLTTGNDTIRGQKFLCSVCKKIAYYPQPTRDKNWVKHCGYPLCPHCGAKMDGVKNG